jgi:hypothetical protein
MSAEAGRRECLEGRERELNVVKRKEENEMRYHERY